MPGLSNPCVFHHPSRDIAIVVHGDDFTALADDEQLDWYEAQLQKSFEIKIGGRLGEGCQGPQEIRILNRIVSVTPEGLQYEADPRHCDLLSSSLNLAASSHAATPGVKPLDRDEHAVKSDDPEHKKLHDYTDPDKMIAAICRGDFDQSPDPCQTECSKLPRKQAGPLHSLSKHTSQQTIASMMRQNFSDELSANGVWVHHTDHSRQLQTPDMCHAHENLDDLSSQRLTVGQYSDGKLLSR